MSIENQITRLQGAKESIKTAIEGKGVTVGDDVKLDGYAELIDSITVGSGDGEEHVNPDFYNVRTNNGTDYNYLFSNYSGTNLDYISNWDTSKVINMYYMFTYCANLTSLDLSNFNTTKVTNMGSMFNYCRNLTSLDLSNFDTSSVENMGSMFNSCSSLTMLDLSNFNTSSVTNMSSMFNGCTKLISVDITGWDTAKVTNMNSMFYDYSNMALKHVYGELDLSGLTNGFYPSAYTALVNGCKSLKTLYLKNIYKNCTMTNATKWSINLGDTAVKDECLIYIINELPDLINDKGLATTTNIILTLPQTNTLTEEQVKIATDKGWQVANTTYHLPSYTVTYNVDKNIMYEGKQIVKEGIPFSLTLEATDDYAINSVAVTMGNTTVEPTYTKDKSGFITAAKINITSVTGDITITATAEEAIRYSSFTVGVADPSLNNTLCITPKEHSSIREVTINGKTQTIPSGTNSKSYTVNDGDEIKIIGEFYINNSTISSVSNFVLQSNITSMYCMFKDCKSLTSIDLSNCNTAKVTTMVMMFSNCESLTSLDLSNLDASNVTDMSRMFYNCSSLTALDVSNWDTSNVTNMGNMFGKCSSLTSLDLSGWNTSSVTITHVTGSYGEVYNMFEECTSLTSITFGSGWDTSNINNMSYMFSGCSSLTSLDLSSFNTNLVTNMRYMFQNCSSLTSLDVSNWDTSSVTNMIGAFKNCTNLTSLDVSNWDTSRVTHIGWVFYNCSSLTSLDVSNWDTSNVTDLRYTFYNCSSLTSLDLNKWSLTLEDQGMYSGLSHAFYNCSSLELLDISNFDTKNITVEKKDDEYTGTTALNNIPSACVIYINPDTFINKKTGKTFTPANLGWGGTAFTPKYN